MPQITGKIVGPGGTPIAVASIEYALVDESRNLVPRGFGPNDETIVTSNSVGVDASGNYQITVIGNTDINPNGTLWRRRIVIANVAPIDDYFFVPTTGGPYTESEVIAPGF